MSYAIVTLSGHVGGDSETRKTRDGEVLSFSVAVNSKRGGEEFTDWYRCFTFFDKLIPILEDVIRKGTQVNVVGKLGQQKWQDRDGVTQTTCEVLISDITWASAGGRSEGRDDGGRSRDDRPAARGRDDRPARGRDDDRGRGRDERPARGRDDDRGRGGRDERPARGRDDDRGTRPAARDDRPAARGREDDRRSLSNDIDDDIPF